MFLANDLVLENLGNLSLTSRPKETNMERYSMMESLTISRDLFASLKSFQRDFKCDPGLRSFARCIRDRRRLKKIRIFSHNWLDHRTKVAVSNSNSVRLSKFRPKIPRSSGHLASLEYSSENCIQRQREGGKSEKFD